MALHSKGATASDIDQFEHVRRLHIGRHVSGVVLIALALWIVIAFARGQIEWHVVGQFLTAQAILAGLAFTVLLTALAMLLGITLGVTVAVAGLSANPIARWLAGAYVWFFRGTPVLLQLMLWFNLALVFPTIGIPGLYEARTVDVMTPFFAALLGLGLCQGAYTSEVVRAGLLSVGQGQYEAASSIGMPRFQALRRIILPQAMRAIVPPIGNEVIGMVKMTSLASVVQVSEIMYNAQNIYYVNNHVIELLIVVTIWYLIVVSILSVFQKKIERYYSRGAGRGAQSRRGR
nr:amino acid ABC transporter permease [Bradyrhizobium brasilense]